MNELSALTEPSPGLYVAALARLAERVETPCGDGMMVWRVWGEGAPLALLHGGHGSWTHWVRNVRDLSRSHRVAVPDMPGYGESASPVDLRDPYSLARPIAEGLRRIFGGKPAALAGFSFGGVIGGHVAAVAPDLANRLVLVGSGGLGLTRPPLADMKSWRRAKTQRERNEAHRHNLQTLMLHDPARIDALAVHLQSENTTRTRINSPAISRTDALRRRIQEVKIPLAGIWGEADATAKGFLEERRTLLREIDPEAEFVTIPNAGHWVQYEAPTAFNRALEGILGSGRTR